MPRVNGMRLDFHIATRNNCATTFWPWRLLSDTNKNVCNNINFTVKTHYSCLLLLHESSLTLKFIHRATCRQSKTIHTHLLHCIQDWCGSQAQPQISGCGFAHALCGAHVVEHVVHQLEGKTCVPAILICSLTDINITATQDSNLVQGQGQSSAVNWHT